jgi:hypothetical protein
MITLHIKRKVINAYPLCTAVIMLPFFIYAIRILKIRGIYHNAIGYLLTVFVCVSVILSHTTEKKRVSCLLCWMSLVASYISMELISSFGEYSIDFFETSNHGMAI